jgi:hypothetical protein
LEEKRKLEQETLAEQKRIEEEQKRIEKEKEIEAEKEAAKIAAEKKSEEERIARESFVCTMTNERHKELVIEEICDELATTRRMDTNARFEIARKHGFGVKGATLLSSADRVENNCGSTPGLLISLACLDDALQKAKKSY